MDDGWAATGDWVNQLGERLARPLPGLSAMLPLAPANRSFLSPEAALRAGAREAAALVLLYPHRRPAAVHTVLTRRAPQLRDHGGQVSFAGGRLDPDETPEQAALREGWEELGVPADRLVALGRLSSLHIPPSDFLVHPVVAAARARPGFQPHAPEVAEIIEVPLALLLDGASIGGAVRRRRGADRRTPCYRLGRHEVWGATAMILAELAAVWAEIDHLTEAAP